MSFLSSHHESQGHPSQAPGFGTALDPFGSISQNRADDDDDGIDFEDTYDGLGDQLDEADDDLNNDTFGGGEASNKLPGKDFDFSGSTNQGSNVINEEAVRYNRYPQSTSRPFISPSSPGPSRQNPKPFKTGYEAYKNPGYIPDLQVDPSLWATNLSQQKQNHDETHNSQPPSFSVAPPKKMMSLEE
ncbi:MAG: hypothetical protein Q9164_007724, partial [Protoblastenia rupestris]